VLRFGAGTQARVDNVDDAYTWGCWRASGEGTKVDGPNLGQYCRQKFGPEAQEYLEGQPQGRQAAYKWRCRQPVPTALEKVATVSFKSTLGTPTATVPYESFHEYDPDPNNPPDTKVRAKTTLYPWVGRHVTFLVPTPNGHPTDKDKGDPEVMKRMLNVFDETYEYFVDVVGGAPARSKYDTQGRLTIAAIEPTCGAACGLIGATGIEMSNGVYVSLYDSVSQSLKDNKSPPEVDQAVFYEFGRNFWVFTDKLAYQEIEETQPDGTKVKLDVPGAVITGYAIAMRFHAMDGVGVTGSQFKPTVTFKQLRERVSSLVDDYVADPSLTWENTLGRGKGIPHRRDAAGNLTDVFEHTAKDFFASFLLRLVKAHGGSPNANRAYLKRLWSQVREQPNRQTTEDARENFIVAASLAANTNLAPVFEKWRWPPLRPEALEKLKGLRAPKLSEYGL
jgi:hypothetical protein